MLHYVKNVGVVRYCQRRHKIESKQASKHKIEIANRGTIRNHLNAVHVTAKTKNVAARAATWERTSTDCGRGSFSFTSFTNNRDPYSL